MEFQQSPLLPLLKMVCPGMDWTEPAAERWKDEGIPYNPYKLMDWLEKKGVATLEQVGQLANTHFRKDLLHEKDISFSKDRYNPSWEELDVAINFISWFGVNEFNSLPTISEMKQRLDSCLDAMIIACDKEFDFSIYGDTPLLVPRVWVDHMFEENFSFSLAASREQQETWLSSKILQVLEKFPLLACEKYYDCGTHFYPFYLLLARAFDKSILQEVIHLFPEAVSRYDDVDSFLRIIRYYAESIQVKIIQALAEFIPNLTKNRHKCLAGKVLLEYLFANKYPLGVLENVAEIFLHSNVTDLDLSDFVENISAEEWNIVEKVLPKLRHLVCRDSSCPPEVFLRMIRFLTENSKDLMLQSFEIEIPPDGVFDSDQDLQRAFTEFLSAKSEALSKLVFRAACHSQNHELEHTVALRGIAYGITSAEKPSGWHLDELSLEGFGHICSRVVQLLLQHDITRWLNVDVSPSVRVAGLDFSKPKYYDTVRSYGNRPIDTLNLHGCWCDRYEWTDVWRTIAARNKLEQFQISSTSSYQGVINAGIALHHTGRITGLKYLNLGSCVHPMAASEISPALPAALVSSCLEYVRIEGIHPDRFPTSRRQRRDPLGFMRYSYCLSTDELELALSKCPTLKYLALENIQLTGQNITTRLMHGLRKNQNLEYVHVTDVKRFFTLNPAEKSTFWRSIENYLDARDLYQLTRYNQEIRPRLSKVQDKSFDTGNLMALLEGVGSRLGVYEEDYNEIVQQKWSGLYQTAMVRGENPISDLSNFYEALLVDPETMVQAWYHSLETLTIRYHILHESPSLWIQSSTQQSLRRKRKREE